MNWTTTFFRNISIFRHLFTSLSMLTRRALETSEIFDRIQSANVLDISSCELSVKQSRATASLFHAIDSICCCARVPWLIQHNLYSLLHHFMTVQSGKYGHPHQSHKKNRRIQFGFIQKRSARMNDQIQYKENVHV